MTYKLFSILKSYDSVDKNNVNAQQILFSTSYD